MQVLRHSTWVAPTVQRAIASKLALPPPPSYELNVHYTLVAQESGSIQRDLPIWAPAPSAVAFESEAGPVVRTEVPDVKGAFVLSNVLTPTESAQLLRLSQAMGFTPDAPVSLGRNIRRNDNCVLIAPGELWRPIWERVAASMPPHVAGGTPQGLNQRWRLYRYGVDDIFKMHTDGSWPGSGLKEDKLVRDVWGDRWSQLTFLIYLDQYGDDYEGGETTFWVPREPIARGAGDLVSVRVPVGGVLCFFHGEHPLSPLHEGSLVTRGTKHIVRSDVLYSLPATSARGEL